VLIIVFLKKGTAKVGIFFVSLGTKVKLL